METLEVEKANEVCWNVARRVQERYPDSAIDDLSQELWLWIVEHQAEILSWEEEEWVGRLYKRGYRVASALARRDRAAARGYEPVDEFFYSLKMLRTWLPYYYADGLDETDPIMLDRDFAMDVQTALPELDGETQHLLVHVFAGDDAEARTASVAASEDITLDAARMKVQRALRRLQRSLGGPNPYDYTNRKVLSNAQAAAITRNQYGD